MTWTVQIDSFASLSEFQSFAECEEALGQWSMLLDGGRFCSYFGRICFEGRILIGFSISNGYRGSKFELWDYATGQPL